MKNEILDTPIIDSFEDFLDKGEKIIWRGFSVEHKDSIYRRNKDGIYAINFKNLFFYIFGSSIELTAALVLGFLFGVYNIIAILTSWIFYVIIFCILLLFLAFQAYVKKRRNNEYVITSKRILFQFAHLPKNDIQQIIFSELKDCIVNLDADGFGNLYLAAKNPENLPDKLFTDHSPKLDRIKNHEGAADLIRDGIKNANKLL